MVRRNVIEFAAVAAPLGYIPPSTETLTASSPEGNRATHTSGTKTDLIFAPTGWGPNGDVLVYRATDLKDSSDLYAFWLKDNRQERLSINSAFNQQRLQRNRGCRFT